MMLSILLLVGSAHAATYNVLNYGADPSGRTPSTTAVHAALEAIKSAQGGTLYFPPGHFLTGPFNLTSNTILLLDGSTLIATDQSTFSLVPPLPSYGEGRDKLPNDMNGRFQPWIGVYNAASVSITTNSSGMLHGRGAPWWVSKDAGTLQNTPPHLLEVGWSSDFSIGAPPGFPMNALILQDSPFWNAHLYDSDNNWVHDVTILADPLAGNTDGVDPDSSRNTLIERVVYVGGDDGVAIKSGWDDAGIKYGKPVVNVTVRDSHFTTRACCVCVGSEMSGGASDISVSNVTCVGVGNAAYVKSSPGRGGYVRNFNFTDSTFYGVNIAMGIMLSYGDNPNPPLTYNVSNLPIMDNFYFARIKGNGVVSPGSLSGSPGKGAPGITITNIRVEDVDLGVTQKPWECTNVSGTSSNVFPQPCPQLGG